MIVVSVPYKGRYIYLTRKMLENPEYMNKISIKVQKQ